MGNSGKEPAAAAGPDLRALLLEADWLRRLAHHLVREGSAEDLVQDTWVAALRSPPDPARPARPWLREVITNFAWKRLRTDDRRERRHREGGDEVAGTAAAPVDELYERVQLQQLVAERVMALPEPYKATVLLRYYDGRSAAEIAEQLEIPAGTVRWRLKEGLDRLRRELDDRNGGDRQRWVRVLLPVAPGAGAGTTLGQGALLMSKGKALIGTMGVALAALVVGGVYLGTRDHIPDAAAASRRADGLALLDRGVGGLRVFGASDRSSTGARVQGIVRDPSGQPVAGAVISASRVPEEPRPPGPPASQRILGSARSDQDGRFVVAGLPPGTHQLIASAPAFAPARSEKLTLAEQSDRDDIVLTLVAGGLVLSGQVQDSGGGPISGAQILASLAGGAPALALSDGKGHYRMRLPRGIWALSADADGYAPARSDLDLLADFSRSFTLQPAGSISGRVIDRSGTGVAGALVRGETDGRTGQPPEHTTSGADGTFTLGDLNPGRYQLSAAAGTRVGFVSGATAVSQTEIATGVVIKLEEAFTIAGQVTDPAGQPVASAHVTMGDATGVNQGVLSGRVITLADEDGRYRIEGVLPGRYRVGVRASPHAPAMARDLEIKAAPLTGVDFELGSGARVEGQLLSHEGQPVPGATINAMVRERDAPDARWTGNGRARSDDHGRFLIEGLGGGALRVRAEQAGHGSHEEGPLALDPGERKVLTIRFPAPAFLEGSVTWDSGGPAAGAQVRYYGFGQGAVRSTAPVGPDGRFRLGPLAPGGGEVTAERGGTTASVVGGGEAPHKKQVTITAGQTTDGVQLVLARNDKTISGIVLGPDGPMAGAQVYAGRRIAGPRDLDEREGGTTSGPDGRFVVTRLVAGSHEVWAKHPRFAPAEQLDVEAGSTGVKLRFEPAASFSGVAVSREGAPVTDYTIAAIPPESQGVHNGMSSGRDIGSRVKVRDPGGAFTIEPLPAGRYDLILTTPDGRTGRLAAQTLTAGQRRRGLTVPVGAGATIRGRVLDADSGQPLPGLGVGVRGNREHVHARTDATGTFSIDGQIPGRTLLLSVRGFETHMSENREVTLPVDQPLVEIPPIHLLSFPRAAQPSAPSVVGLDTTEAAGPPRVRRVLAGSPADRAGIRVGDLLQKVGGRDVSALGPLAVAMLLRGPTGSTVEVVLQPAAGESSRSVTLTRAPFDPASLTRTPLTARGP